MTLFAREDLHRLLAPHEGPCVSLYMPTHRHGPGNEQDPIRFKNLLKAAERSLSERYGSREIEALLAPLAALSDPWFWRYQMDGLALFRSPDLAEHYHLPIELPERAVVAGSFHVKPMLRFLQANQRYYVLAISQNAVALYQGTPFSLGPVDLATLPASLADVLGVERRETTLTVRTTGPGKGPVFHGHGAPDRSRKDDLQKFFRAVDRALWELMRDDPAPLILAGVGYYFPIYAELSRCRTLVGEGVEGSFDETPAEALHDRVWPVAREVLRGREDAAVEGYRAAIARRLATAELGLVGTSAVHGRVRRLLLAEGAALRGRLDQASGEVVLTPAGDGHDDDVLDDLAEAVLGRGGEVFLLPRERMPEPGPVAAELRW